MVKLNIEDIEDIISCDACGVLLDKDVLLTGKQIRLKERGYCDAICPVCKNKITIYEE